MRKLHYTFISNWKTGAYSIHIFVRIGKSYGFIRIDSWEKAAVERKIHSVYYGLEASFDIQSRYQITYNREDKIL